MDEIQRVQQDSLTIYVRRKDGIERALELLRKRCESSGLWAELDRKRFFHKRKKHSKG